MDLDGISAPLQKLISPATLESLTKVPNCSILSGTCPSQCRQTATCYARSQIWTSFWSERFSSDFQLFRSCLKDTYVYPFNAGWTSTGLPLWETVHLWNTTSLMIQGLGCLIAFLLHVPIAWSEINVLLQWSWTVEQCQRQWFSPSLFWW